MIARFVNHVWMMDISVVQALLGGEFYMAAVFDAFCRVPLAISTHEHKPGASAMARLLRTAARSFGTPKYLITDQGTEFTGKVFRKAVSRLGIVHRFGSTQNLRHCPPREILENPQTHREPSTPATLDPR